MPVNNPYFFQMLSAVKISQLAQRTVILLTFRAVAAEDDMVEHLDLEHLAGADEIARESHIGFGWRWVAAGMIVHEDDRRRARADGGFKDFARMDQNRVERALRNFIHADEFASGVE